MCYSMLCKYQDWEGECRIIDKLGTDEMPTDAECQKYYEEEQTDGDTSINSR